MIVSIVLLTISIYFLMGMFIQERQDNQFPESRRVSFVTPFGIEKHPISQYKCFAILV